MQIKFHKMSPSDAFHNFCSASLDRHAENVRVLPVIIAELEFGDIERHIFTAHFVERTDHTALFSF
jgi:hypothetical protein